MSAVDVDDEFSVVVRATEAPPGLSVRWALMWMRRRPLHLDLVVVVAGRVDATWLDAQCGGGAPT